MFPARTSIIALLFAVIPLSVGAQTISAPDTTQAFGTGAGVDIALTNSGFGAGTHAFYSLTPTTSVLAEIRVVPGKDARETAFFDQFGGRDIPLKYNYLLKFPIRFGIHQRLWASQIEDNFRPHLYVAAGPTLAWTYPYFDDVNGNRRLDDGERTYGNLESLRRGEGRGGVGAIVMIGAHFGAEDSTLRSVRFGYSVDYFFDPLQLLEPHARDPQHAFATPIITLSFGRLW